jgi:hypothetical protein
LKSLIPILILLLISCNARYGYLNKVRVGGNHTERLKTAKVKPQKEEKVETSNEIIEENVTAELDTNQSLMIIPQKPWEPNDKSNSLVNSKSEKKNQEKKSERKEKGKDGENYYARWAYILTIICISGFILIIPIALAPLIVTLSIIALTRIKKTREKGRKKAIFTLLLGLAITVFALAFLLIGGSVLMATIILGITLLFDLFWFILIKYSSKNPDNKVDRNTLKPLDRSTRKYVIKAFIYGCLTAGLSFILIGFVFGLPAFRNAIIALKGIQKERRSLRFLMYFFMLIGILGAIGLPILGILLLGGFFSMYNASAILGIIIIGLIIMLGTAAIGFTSNK